MIIWCTLFSESYGKFVLFYFFVCFLTAVQFSDKMMKRLQVRLQQLYPRARLEAFFSEPWTILLCTSSPAEQPVLVIRRCSGEFPTAWILHIRLHSHCALTSLAFKNSRKLITLPCRCFGTSVLENCPCRLVPPIPAGFSWVLFMMVSVCSGKPLSLKSFHTVALCRLQCVCVCLFVQRCLKWK